MNRANLPYLAIGVLGILLVGSSLLLAWGYWQIYGIAGWRDQLYASASSVGSRQALDDFRAGRLRLYAIGGRNEGHRYSGTNDGPFEIWIRQFYPELGRAHRFSAEEFIRAYNSKMRYMQAHPDQFRQGTKQVQDTAANRNQPARVDTNSTSLTAGPRRSP